MFCLYTGCPTPGYYGEYCSLPCPHNCQEDYCHIVDGTCLGCVPGYTGSKCDIGEWFVLRIKSMSVSLQTKVLFILNF